MAFVTGETAYRTDAQTYYSQNGYDSYVQEFFDWDNKHMGTYMRALLYF